MKYNRKQLKQVCEQLWNNRTICRMCGGPLPYEPISWCFGHIFPKGIYPQYATLPNNIEIVCGIGCHKDLDRATAKKLYLLEEDLLAGKRLDF